MTITMFAAIVLLIVVVSALALSKDNGKFDKALFVKSLVGNIIVAIFVIIVSLVFAFFVLSIK